MLVLLRHSRRSFVDRVDFVTSIGHYFGHGTRGQLGLIGRGHGVVITDIGVLRPEPGSRELVLSALHPGRTVEEAVAATGWPLRVADDLAVTVPPSELELRVLRDLEAGAA